MSTWEEVVLATAQPYLESAFQSVFRDAIWQQFPFCFSLSQDFADACSADWDTSYWCQTVEYRRHRIWQSWYVMNVFLCMRFDDLCNHVAACMYHVAVCAKYFQCAVAALRLIQAGAGILHVKVLSHLGCRIDTVVCTYLLAYVHAYACSSSFKEL